MIAQLFLSLLLVASTLAAPLDRRDTCSVPATALNLQPPFTPLSSPPRSVVLGVGVQNYTCDSSGKYSSDGAIAGLIDITCLYGTADFAEIQDDIFKIWEGYNGPNPFEVIFDFSVDFNITIIAVHYFINDDGAFLPKFDFSLAGPTAGNTDAFVVGSIDIAVTAPDGAHDVNWFEIRAVSGKFADEVYCVETRGGQPPDSCTPGSDPISINYVAQYWFEGGSL